MKIISQLSTIAAVKAFKFKKLTCLKISTSVFDARDYSNYLRVIIIKILRYIRKYSIKIDLALFDLSLFIFISDVKTSKNQNPQLLKCISKAKPASITENSTILLLEVF